MAPGSVPLTFTAAPGTTLCHGCRSAVAQKTVHVPSAFRKMPGFLSNGSWPTLATTPSSVYTLPRNFRSAPLPSLANAARYSAGVIVMAGAPEEPFGPLGFGPSVPDPVRPDGVPSGDLESVFLSLQPAVASAAAMITDKSRR